ncbi:MAG: tetratricopeptide repeat protein [Ekhidna sp.]|uniref:tetratricopeptide repeat protein n=1 Tax=Ekhidna sp. TaxID=2608089 RepID=UPI0032EAD569
MKKIILLIAFMAAMELNGQTLMESATEKFNNQDWAGAVKDYTKYLKKNTDDSAAWYNLATSQKNLENYDEALSSFAKAKETNFNPFFVDFNVAKIYALQGDAGMMYQTLESAAANGLFAYARLQSDTEFAPYQDEKRFKEVLSKVELNAYPCLSDPDCRHFDFWIGEWDVYVGPRKVGDNSITMAQGGCAIHENYITAGNYSGQSINFYSPVDKKWHQHWVGSGGDVYNYVETKREEGMLQFVSDFMTPQGTVTLSRLTFTLNEDGTVRQLFESSSDEGKTWTPAFDGLYKRKESN